MASLKYFNYPGYGEIAAEHLGYSQAVRIDNRLELSGQGGWDQHPTSVDDIKIPDDLDAQVDQAFANVDLALKHAGGKGWSQVFKVRSYHVGYDETAMNAMIRNYKKWMPNHRPIWTLVGVAALGLPQMKVEIEVIAVLDD